MRRIGNIKEEDKARQFGDYLLAQGYENKVEDYSDEWAIWVMDEDQLEAAEEEFEAFLQNPGDPKYRESADTAQQIRKKAEKEEKRWRGMYRDLRTDFHRDSYSRFPVTIALMVISLAVALVTHLGGDISHPVIGWLSFAQFWTDGFSIRWQGAFKDILSGQVWRLFTPMFLHFGIFHIVFNMIWLYDLGSQIEARKGLKFFLLMVLVIAGLSNTAQYLVSGPLFGGMSGVVYGLLGYIWMKMKFQPLEGLGISPTTVTIMLIWLVVCMLGVVGSVANTVHLVGLVTGMAFGYAPYALHRLRSGR